MIFSVVQTILVSVNLTTEVGWFTSFVNGNIGVQRILRFLNCVYHD